MSDGEKASDGNNQNSSSSSNQRRAFGGDEFGRAIARIAAAQICDSVGFASSHRSALDALADVTVRYICDLGKAARFYAELSGRTACNVFDIIQALEDLGSAHGFGGASDVNRCLVASGVVKEVAHFVNLEKEVPFARPVPSFPIALFKKPVLSFAQKGEEPKGKHIPDWLPAFPDPHTYVHTPVWNERETDLRAEKIEQARQRRKQERSLINLQQRLISCNGMPSPVREVDDDVAKGKQVVSSNPFLAEPLPPGDKEVTVISIPDEPVARKRFSVLETFAPAIDAAMNGSFDPGISEKKLLPNKRPTLSFKLGIDKKSLALPLSSSAFGRKTDSWFLRDDEKDDKKRRAEMILKEAMENPQELTQL